MGPALTTAHPSFPTVPIIGQKRHLRPVICTDCSADQLILCA
jgi:hypothetical protein